jgi:hypothetical protein
LVAPWWCSFVRISPWISSVSVMVMPLCAIPLHRGIVVNSYLPSASWFLVSAWKSRPSWIEGLRHSSVITSWCVALEPLPTSFLLVSLCHFGHCLVILCLERWFNAFPVIKGIESSNTLLIKIWRTKTSCHEQPIYHIYLVLVVLLVSGCCSSLFYEILL